MSQGRATIGIADHAGWAVAVTVAPGGEVIDRRRLVLLDPALPCLPHHHDAQGLPLDEAEQLIARVRASAEACSAEALGGIATSVAVPIVAVSLRACPALPPTLAERLGNYRAQCVADSVMYREILAAAATERGWSVAWHDRRRVLGEAARTLGTNERGLAASLAEIGARLGPPWQADHRVATAAAIVALHGE